MKGEPLTLHTRSGIDAITSIPDAGLVKRLKAAARIAGLPHRRLPFGLAEYNLAGEWGIHFPEATDVLLFVDENPVRTLHRPQNSKEIYSIELGQGGDELNRRLALEALGFVGWETAKQKPMGNNMETTGAVTYLGLDFFT